MRARETGTVAVILTPTTLYVKYIEGFNVSNSMREKILSNLDSNLYVLFLVGFGACEN